jgi:hypothetical protein
MKSMEVRNDAGRAPCNNKSGKLVREVVDPEHSPANGGLRAPEAQMTGMSELDLDNCISQWQEGVGMFQRPDIIGWSFFVHLGNRTCCLCSPLRSIERGSAS